MMAAHPYPTLAGTLQLVGTSEGIAITGPGGRVLLTSRMVAQLAEFSIALLDVLQADPDLEDATGLEDAFEEHTARIGYRGPGCPVADPGGCEHDGREEDRG